MRSLLVLPILALARGGLAQEVSPSDSSPSSTVDPVVPTDTGSSTPTAVPNNPSTTPTDASEPAVITTTPTATDSLVTSITSSEQGSSTGSSASVSASASTDVDDPQATYVIPSDYYDVADVDEGVIVDVAPTMEEAVDLGAMEVDAYADVVADSKLAVPDNPQDVTQPVVCVSRSLFLVNFVYVVVQC